MANSILAAADLGLVDLFQRGGLVMWPLLLCSVLAIAAILDRAYFFLFRQRYRLPAVLDASRSALENGRVTPPASLGTDPASRIASVYLENLGATTDHRRNVVQREAARHLRRAENRVRLLATVAALSPLIGLLGTVWGMVGAFSAIEVLEQVKPSDVAGGIWSALLTTVFGLAIAIPAVAVTRWAEARVDRLADDLNTIVSSLDDWSGKVTQL